jgi:hypothetical protein
MQEVPRKWSFVVYYTALQLVVGGRAVLEWALEVEVEVKVKVRLSVCMPGR